MKGGSLFCWRTVVGVVGSTSPGVALRPSASVGCWESGAEWPWSVGIRRERVEAVGAAGRTTWTAVVGLADETSARGGFCGVSLGRSSRRQPFTTACPGGDALPQGGGAAPNGCVAERRSENLGACQLWKENHRGVKIIRAQDYAGVDTPTINFQRLLPVLGSVYQAVQQWEEAKGALAEAVAMAERLDLRTLRAPALSRLCMHSAEAGEWDQASRYALEAITARRSSDVAVIPQDFSSHYET